MKKKFSGPQIVAKLRQADILIGQGKKRNGLVVEDVALLGTLKERRIDLGIIAVPGDAAQNVANDLIKVGVKAILNFAQRYIEAPKRVKVITIDIALYLARLPYYVLT